MSRIAPVTAPNIDKDVAATLSQVSSAVPSKSTKSSLTRLAAWINDHNVPFLVTSIGMIVMLLWAGSYKMTAPGAEGIIPLVSNSPLISWHFKLFGPYIGSDLLIIFGHKAPVNGGWIGLPLLYPEERFFAITKSPQIFQSCTGRNIVPGASGHCRPVEFIDLILPGLLRRRCIRP